MSDFRSLSVLGPAFVIGAAALLGACGSMTTYGTGKSAAAQTFEDLGGVLALGGTKNNEEPIDYSPRAPIVEPPAVAAALPPPGGETVVATAGDWPKDPDEEFKKLQKKVEELAESGQTPKFTLPEGAEPIAVSNAPKRIGPDDRTSVEKLRDEAKVDNKKQKEMFADAKMAKTGSFDKEGRPIRRYLTEPPVVYREPDPESPVVITQKPKKGKWAWPDLWPF
jgi:hypothetical protein